MINRQLIAFSFFGSPRPTAVLGAFLLAGNGLLLQARDAHAERASAVMGAAGDAASWRSEEFLRDWGLSAMGADHAYARGLSGRSVALGVLDSGLFAQHPEFSGADKIRALRLGDPACDTGARRVMGGCFHTQGNQPQIDVSHGVDDDDGKVFHWIVYLNHGTHVAGTIAANRDGLGMHGTAFGASLAVARFMKDQMKVHEPDGSVSWHGGEYPSAMDLKDYYRQLAMHGVRATNHSSGFDVPSKATLESVRGMYDEGKDAYDAMADESIRHDIISVTALGNQRGEITGPFAGLPAFRPDAEPYWLGVANVQRGPDGSYRIYTSSSICGYAKRWCISAPGTEIYSTVNDASVVSRWTFSGSGTDDDPYTYVLGAHEIDMGYGPLTGTSMAAPHAAGALGLLFERYPYLKSTQVRDVLLTTATPLGPEEIYGWGLINLRKAIDGPGQLLKDTLVTMNRPAGGHKVWNGDAWDDWRNDIGGPGRLVKSGAGWLRLSGSNRFGGLEVRQGVLELTGDNAYPAAVTGGTLLLEGTLASARLSIDQHGTLTGRGRVVGDVHLQGTLAPGHPDGTLTIQGHYLQAAGSRYVAYITPAGATNHLDVTGQAVLLGGQMVVRHAPGAYGLGDTFSVLSAAGGVQGRYAGVEQQPLLPFLRFGLGYAPKAVSVDVVRGAPLASAAITPNQHAVAGAADVLPIRQGLPRALTQLTMAQAPAALSALSGETYASLRSVLVENGRFLRQAVLARGSNHADAGRPAQGAWVDVQQGHGRLQDHGRVAQTTYNGPQLTLGYDYRFDNGWRLGTAAHAGRLSARNRLGDGARIRHQSTGFYAGFRSGAFAVTAGLAATRYRIEQDRTIRFPGFKDQAHAAYTAYGTQVFIEGTHRLSDGVWTLEPYLQWARMGIRTPGLRETGGAAALTAKAQDGAVNLATIGSRLQVALGEGSGWRLRAGLGRRLASGGRQPHALMAFGAGNAFIVQGAPLARATTLLEAGMEKTLGHTARLALDYSGQFASQTRDQAVRATWSMAF